MLQRLFEIEAYRVMALLALPIARGQAPRTLEIERALSTLAGRLAVFNSFNEAGARSPGKRLLIEPINCYDIAKPAGGTVAGLGWMQKLAN